MPWLGYKPTILTSKKWHISHRTANGITLLSGTGIVYVAEFISRRKSGQREDKNDIKWPNDFKKQELYSLFLIAFSDKWVLSIASILVNINKMDIKQYSGGWLVGLTHITET